MPPSIPSSSLGIPGAAAALAALHQTCEATRAPFFVVGALARELLMHQVRNVERSLRLTRDIDIAVGVASWKHFERVRQYLARQHDFRPTDILHRLIAPSGLPVDIVPFGGVENERHAVRWPPGFDIEMSVLGYQEALELTETVYLDDRAIPVISLTAFGPLKVITWADRRHDTPRDAEDFCFVLTHYWQAETEHILDQHADLFEAEEGDQDLIGARAYGRDVARFLARSQQLADTLLAILRRETADVYDSRLTQAMSRSCGHAYERRFTLLQRFDIGVQEGLS